MKYLWLPDDQFCNNAQGLCGHHQSIVTSSAERKASEWDTGMMCEDPRF